MSNEIVRDDEVEHRVELLISWILRIGVATSGLLVVAGMLLVFLHHPSYRRSPSDLGALTSISSRYPHALRDVLASVRRGSGEGVAMLGLLLLIATPVVRVAVSIALFAYEHDRRFVIITTIVLLLLLLSFALGAAGG